MNVNIDHSQLNIIFGKDRTVIVFSSRTAVTQQRYS